MSQEEVSRTVQGRDPLLTRILKGAAVYGIQTLTKPLRQLQSWHQWYRPSQHAPDLVRYYKCRPILPIR